MRSIVLSEQMLWELEDFLLRTSLAKERCRAQALVWLAEGESPQEVAQLLSVRRQTIYNWAKRFVSREGWDLEERLSDAPRSGRPPTALGIIDPLIGEVIDQAPGELGFRSTQWTAPLLAEYLKRRHGIKVSRKSVALALDRLQIRWKRPRHQLALRPESWRQAKGGSNGA